MSFKVEDEVVTLIGGCYFPKGANGVVVELSRLLVLIDFGDDQRVLVDEFGKREWASLPTNLAHACPIARESAKFKADVERFEVEIDAWIARMRRGEW